MPYTKDFLRLRNYLRSHGHDVHIVFNHLEFDGFTFKDLPISGYFQISTSVYPFVSIHIPACSPDTALIKAYSFRDKMIAIKKDQAVRQVNRLLRNPVPCVPGGLPIGLSY